MLVAYGDLLVASEKVYALSNKIDEIADSSGMPDREEIKWCLRKNSWIDDNLKGEDRFNCNDSILNAAKETQSIASVTVCDPAMSTLKPAWDSERCVTYTLERVSADIEHLSSQAVVISDSPSGGKKEDDQCSRDDLNHIERVCKNPMDFIGGTATNKDRHYFKTVADQAISMPRFLLRVYRANSLVICNVIEGALAD
jgi:hypothetical protein